MSVSRNTRDIMKAQTEIPNVAAGGTSSGETIVRGRGAPSLRFSIHVEHQILVLHFLRLDVFGLSCESQVRFAGKGVGM